MRKFLLTLLLCMPLLAWAVVYQQPTTLSGDGLVAAPQASAYSSGIQPAGQLHGPLSVGHATRRGSYGSATSSSYGSASFGSASYGTSPLSKKSSRSAGLSGGGSMGGGSTSFSSSRSGSNSQFSNGAPAAVGGGIMVAMGTMDDDDDEPPTSNTGHTGDEPIITPLGDLPLLLMLILCLAFGAVITRRKKLS